VRNIFLFIRRYFTFVAFLALQVISLSILFRYNKFHHAVGMGVANEFAGWMNSKYSRVDRYFHLNEENDRVHRLNDSLMNLLTKNFGKTDTTTKLFEDSIRYDTLSFQRRYVWRDAQVVYNTVNQQENYFQINRGSKYGIRDNMGVVNSDGALVGVVLNVSENFSQVMSLLNVQNTTSVVMKKSGNQGKITWDGKDPAFLILNDIPKSDSIAKGDTVITGPYSFNYPPGVIVGTVESFLPGNTGSTFYTIRLRAAANFRGLQQVHVVENLSYNEQVGLMNDTKKKMDATKQQRR
jgi:rod shape-determining protein MreC